MWLLSSLWPTFMKSFERYYFNLMLFPSTFYYREFSLRNLRLILLRSQYSLIEIFNTPSPAALQKANDIIHCPLLPSNYPLAGLGSENDSTSTHTPLFLVFPLLFSPTTTP